MGVMFDIPFKLGRIKLDLQNFEKVIKEDTLWMIDTIESQQSEIFKLESEKESLKCCMNCKNKLIAPKKTGDCQFCSRNPLCKCDVLLVDNWKPKENL